MQGGDLSVGTISIFMPAYNAALYLEGVLARFPEDLWQRVAHLWIIDDGSQDTTFEVIERLAGQYGKLLAVRFPENRGYGAVVKEGLGRCRDDRCDMAVCLHGDGQYPPELIVTFSRIMAEGGIDILQGSRIASGTALSGGMPLYKFIANRVLTFFENLVFQLSLSDYHSGMLLYSRTALDSLPFDRLSASFDFDLEVIALSRARGLVIGEQPIPTRYAGEVSHLNPIGYGLRVLAVMANYITGRYARL
jgi:glycosyltransferase involved in cell wall biosynthesis